MTNAVLAKIPFLRSIFKAETPDQRARRKERSRLFWHPYESLEGRRIIMNAHALSRNSELAHLSNAELLRLSYWGDPGPTDTYGREMLKAPENRDLQPG